MGHKSFQKIVSISLLSFLGFLTAGLPAGAESLTTVGQFSGRLVIEMDSQAAWYVNPADQSRYSANSDQEVFHIMRFQSLGITNQDLAMIPTDNNDQSADLKLVNRLKGRILLQVEEHGEAWYVNPEDGLRYYLGRPGQARQILWDLGVFAPAEELSYFEIGQ